MRIAPSATDRHEKSLIGTSTHFSFIPFSIFFVGTLSFRESETVLHIIVIIMSLSNQKEFSLSVNKIQISV